MKHYMIYNVYDGDTLVDSGNVHELAERLSVTKEIIYKEARLGGRLLWTYRVKKAGMRAYPDELDGKIKAEWENGYNRQQIAQRLDVPYATVVKRIQNMAKRGEIENDNHNKAGHAR